MENRNTRKIGYEGNAAPTAVLATARLAVRSVFLARRRARDSSPTLIPGPLQMGVESGLKYAAIESWVELKISSGRQKDQAHIVEVLKKSAPSLIESTQKHLASVRAGYAV